VRPFVIHEGIAAALRVDNVDTDVIITMDDLLSVHASALVTAPSAHFATMPTGRKIPTSSSTVLASVRLPSCLPEETSGAAARARAP